MRTPMCRARKTISIYLFGLMVAIGVGMYQQDSSANDSLGFSYAAISFTPDSQKLVFTRCKADDTDCYIHIYDLKTKALSYYRPPKDQNWYAAKFSPSGKQVVFVLAPRVPDAESSAGDSRLYTDWSKSQIAIMDADGRNIRLLTKHSGLKLLPNFSWSGKKVIYVQGEMRKPGAKTMASKWDVFEINLETGVNNQLTGFKFYQIGRPSYLPGDDRFVVHALGPGKIPGVKDAVDSTYLRGFEKNFNNSRVYVFDAKPGAQKLEPLFSQFLNASNPGVDSYGNLYFSAQPSSADRFRLFQSNTKSALHSWYLPNMQPRYTEVSPDGRYWAVISPAAYPDDLNGIHLFEMASDKWETVSDTTVARLINP